MGASVLLALGVAGPAYAQDCSGACPTTTTTSTTAPSTTTTTAPTTTTTAPPPAQTAGTTTKPTPLPGDSVPISSPPVNNQPALDSTKPVAAVLVPADGDADVPMPQPTITQNANGTVTISVTVPPSTPPGVYFIAIVGSTPSGQSRAIIVPVVVRRRVAASVDAAAAGAPTVAAALPASTRAHIKKLQASVDTAGGPEVLEEQVLEDGATLDVEGAELLVNGRPIVPAEDGDSSRPLVAAAAVALGGAGLVLLRRRTPAISRRTH